MTSDIVTVTMNPAIDETVFLGDLRPGAVNRAEHLHRQAGGKGVNVSSMLGSYGIATIATGFLGKENPELFEQLCAERMIRDEFIRISGKTRTGIKIVGESTRETTDINFPGPEPSAADLQALRAKLHSLVNPGRWFVVAGSLPVGVSLEDFENLLRLLKRGGAKVAVDTSGPPLQTAITCGVDLIKPNHHELEEILGHPLPDSAARVAAALRLQRENVPRVILSLGGEGAIFAGPEGAFMAQPPPVEVGSTVGAGDSLLAGYLAGRVTGHTPADCAKLATAFAWRALENVSRQAPSPAEAAELMARIMVSPLLA